MSTVNNNFPIFYRQAPKNLKNLIKSKNCVIFDCVRNENFVKIVIALFIPQINFKCVSFL